MTAGQSATDRQADPLGSPVARLSPAPGSMATHPTFAILATEDLAPNMRVILYNYGRLIGHDFDLELITGPDQAIDRLTPYLSLHPVPAPSIQGRYGLGYAFKALTSYVRERGRPDVLMNIGVPNNLGVATVTVGRLLDIPHVLRLPGRNIAPWRVPSTWTRQLAQRIVHSYLLGSVYRRAEQVLLLGPDQREVALEHGFDDDRLEVIPQPFDPEPFRPVCAARKRALRSRLGLDDSKRVALTVGLSTRLKGVDRLEEIIEETLRRTDAVQFCLVGDHSDGRFDRFPDEFVQVAGVVPHGDMPAYYRAADRLIHPSRSDGLPNVILEGLAAELSIMASPVGEIDGYVRRTSTEPGDYADFLVDDGVSSDELPDHFDWEHQATTYRDFFRSVADRN